MKRLMIILLLPLATSCSSTLPATDGVRVAVAEHEVAACKLLGSVSGKNTNVWGSMTLNVSINDATAQIKNGTAALGGNTVLITQSSTHIMGANMAGKAYKCSGR